MSIKYSLQSMSSESKKGNYLVWTDINDNGVTEHGLEYFTLYENAFDSYNKKTRKTSAFPTRSNSCFQVSIVLAQIEDKKNMQTMRKFYRGSSGEGEETVTKKGES